MAIDADKPGRYVPVRPDLELAASISVAGCDACTCGAITVRFHDQYGAVFASASVGPKIGATFLEQVRAAVEAQGAAGGLGGMPIEGSA